MSKYKIILALIMAFAAILRFYKLGQVPVALDWDEISMGYNAWALAGTGHDEFGNSWPLTIRSFGDYKPPLYTYFLIPSLKFFGRTEFAVRFPSALVGTLTVLIAYFLVRELFPSKRKTGLWAVLFLAISPWHLQFSRIAFEANLGLFWFVTGMWLFLRSMREKNWFLILSMLSFGLGIMSYHSNRVVTPITILFLVVLFRKELADIWRKNKLSINVSGVIMGGVLLLIGYTLFYQKVGQARFMETSFISTNDNRIFEYGRKFLIGYLDHYDLKFWFLNGDGINRHKAQNFGLLYWWELPLLAVGFVSVLTRFFNGVYPERSRGTRDKKSARTLIFWFLLAPVAAALVKGTPSAVRSLLFLPTFQIFEAVGLISLMKLFKRRWTGVMLAGFGGVILTSFVFYLHQYYIHGPMEQTQDWQYGYKQLVAKVLSEKDKYDQVAVTTEYDQPYIYFLWYGDYDPKKWINNGEFNEGFDKYRFGKINLDDRISGDRRLIIGTSEELPKDKWQWTIDFPDGNPAFVIIDYEQK